MFQESRPRLAPLVSRVGLRYLREHEGRGILQEVETALLASAAMPLSVSAGRAVEIEGRVAAGAEPRKIVRVGSAVGAFHRLILWNKL